jgi:hypothetical protein
MWSLAQYSYQPVNSSSSGMPAIFLVLYLAFIVLVIVAYWRIFEKAGEAGWKSIIPIYNTYIILRIVGYSGWYLLLFIVPLVNVVFAIIVAYKLATAFGYGIGMTILEFVAGIGLLIMAFGDAKYLGPDGKHSNHHTSSSSL